MSYQYHIHIMSCGITSYHHDCNDACPVPACPINRLSFCSVFSVMTLAAELQPRLNPILPIQSGWDKWNVASFHIFSIYNLKFKILLGWVILAWLHDYNYVSQLLNNAVWQKQYFRTFPQNQLSMPWLHTLRSPAFAMMGCSWLPEASPPKSLVDLAGSEPTNPILDFRLPGFIC